MDFFIEVYKSPVGSVMSNHVFHLKTCKWNTLWSVYPRLIPRLIKTFERIRTPLFWISSPSSNNGRSHTFQVFWKQKKLNQIYANNTKFMQKMISFKNGIILRGWQHVKWRFALMWWRLRVVAGGLMLSRVQQWEDVWGQTKGRTVLFISHTHISPHGEVRGIKSEYVCLFRSFFYLKVWAEILLSCFCHFWFKNQRRTKSSRLTKHIGLIRSLLLLFSINMNTTQPPNQLHFTLFSQSAKKGFCEISIPFHSPFTPLTSGGSWTEEEEEGNCYFLFRGEGQEVSDHTADCTILS